MPTLTPTNRLTGIRSLIDSIEQSGFADGEEMIWLQTEQAFDTEIGVIGPDLYTGMAGMAITFANAFRTTGRERYAAIAHHAIRYALDHADAVPEEHRLGFYNGWSGILYAAVYLHRTLGRQDLLLKAEQLLRRLREVPPGTEYDLMTGAAGAVLGAAIVAPVLGAPARNLVAVAARHLRTAADPVAGSEALTWKTASDQLPLTGVSHGNAGIGWALCEGYGLTREPGLRNLAHRAFQYERQYFDAAAGNWYDLRHYSSVATLNKIPPQCEVAWCHGAGGIALSRLRAYELTRNPDYLPELKAAARTLHTNVLQAHPQAELPSCLCHGLVGNLDILLTLHRRAGAELPFLDPPLPFDAELADYAADLPPEPPDPGLMLGIGGLAHYLMRRMDGDLASVLYPVGVGGGA